MRRKHKRLVLALVFMLASSRFTRTTQRRKHKHKHKHKRMERFPFSCACAYACVVRVHRDNASISISTTEHELSVEYLLGVRHLEFKIVAPKFKIHNSLRLRMPPCAYAYHTCKQPCAYAYACVVRVNQPFVSLSEL